MESPWRLCGAIVAALAATYLLTRSRRSTRLTTVRRRAAFDIGSGASKLLVADVDTATGVIVGSPLYEVERPLAFKADSQQSPDGSLSSIITAEGLDLIASLAATARDLGAIETSGIATEVFRTAPNGLAFLSAVGKATGVRITTLSQETEARLGLATAEALLGGPRHVRAAWDSGGGSFQITARADADSAQEHNNIDAAALRTYVGKLGTGPSFHRLLTSVQQKPYDANATVNPTAPAEADALVDLLQAELPAAPAWLRGQPIIAIGGWNCIFATTLRALRILVGSHHGAPGGGGDSAGSCQGASAAACGMAGGSYTIEDARRALAAVCERSDEQLLAISGSGAEAERAAFVVPKIALLVAVASHLKVSSIQFVPATGGCAGLMALGEFARLPPQPAVSGTNHQGCVSRTGAR